MKKIIKIVNPKRCKNPILIQSPFRRIKRADTFKAKNPKEYKKTISLIKKNINMSNPKKRTRRKNPVTVSNPAIVANKKRRMHRRRNPSNTGGGIGFNMGYIKELLMDGAIVGGSMIATNWATNYINSKWLQTENKWLRYLMMFGIGVAGGWLIGKANSRVGKNFAVGATALTIWTIANENLDFLKQQKLQVLKGYDDEDALLGNLTLGELIEAREMAQNVISQNNAELSGELVDNLEGNVGDVNTPMYGDEGLILGAGAEFPEQQTVSY